MIESKTTKITCLHCPSCVGSIENSMLAVDGIEDIKINFKTGKMHVKYDSNKLTLSEIRSLIDRQSCRILEEEIEEEETFSLKNREFTFTLISGVALFTGLFVMFATEDPLLFDLYFSFNLSVLIFIVSMVFGGFYVARRAVKGFRAKRFVIDSLMIIGALGSAPADCDRL